MPLMTSLTNSRALPVPRDLPRAIAEARAALEAHLAARPPVYPTPIRAQWAEAKDLLLVRLEFLDGCARTQWTDLDVAGKLVGEVDLDQAPKRRPRPRKSPRKRLAGALQKQASLLRDVRRAQDARTCAALRQQVFTLRNEMKRLCRESSLVLPRFAPVPNPWAQGVAR